MKATIQRAVVVLTRSVCYARQTAGMDTGSDLILSLLVRAGAFLCNSAVSGNVSSPA